jgi:ketosteroid isomerase-like protein
MSANLDLVRSICGPWERGDFTATAWADPQIEWEFPDGLEPQSSTGKPALSWRYREWLSTWQDVRFASTDFRELDHQRVLVLGYYLGRGKTSGLELGRIRSQVAALFHIRSGKVTRLVLYLDREHAFADLGLAREAG